MYAVGFHTCQKDRQLKWKKGTLYGGVTDFQRVLFNLHRRGVPTERLKEKADEYVLNGDLSLDLGKAIMATIESERGKQRLVNAAAGAGEDDADNGRISDKLTLADMQAELDKRVELMRAGAADSGRLGTLPFDASDDYSAPGRSIRRKTALVAEITTSAGRDAPRAYRI